MKLKKKSVVKPWGQFDLPKLFGGKSKKQIGEIWFEPPEGISLGLMIKYLFTSEKLSIQVHPNDRFARRQGLPHGKEECWYVLDAEPDSVLGIGLVKEVSSTKLRTAAMLGEIEQLIDWKPVQAGDFFYIPAGTIHAIGPGISLVEVQQNVDVTYRLYDYGRPRELHLDDGISVSNRIVYDMSYHQHVDPKTSAVLVDGPHFRVFHVVGDRFDEISNVTASEWQVIPLEGSVEVRGVAIAPSHCSVCPRITDIDLSKNVRSIIACNMK